MVSFQTKNTNLGNFWRALDWKMLIYFMAPWNILQAFGTFCVRFWQPCAAVHKGSAFLIKLSSKDYIPSGPS
jgi:hypothetical protein